MSLVFVTKINKLEVGSTLGQNLLSCCFHFCKDLGKKTIDLDSVSEKLWNKKSYKHNAHGITSTVSATKFNNSDCS